MLFLHGCLAFSMRTARNCLISHVLLVQLHAASSTADMQGLYQPMQHDIVTAASCTTNCLAPIVKVIHEQFGIEKGALTTIHCVTNTQTIIDAPNSKKSDLRRARSGLMNLAPTSTGSATAIALIFPELKGKLNGRDLVALGLQVLLSGKSAEPQFTSSFAVSG
jgi:hypothetical protein